MIKSKFLLVMLLFLMPTEVWAQVFFGNEGELRQENKVDGEPLIKMQQEDVREWMERVRERQAEMEEGDRPSFGEEDQLSMGVNPVTHRIHEWQDLNELDRYSRVDFRPFGMPLPNHTDDAGIPHTIMTPTLPFTNSCMDPFPVLGAACFGLIPVFSWPPYRVYARPMMEYYMPFQMVETHDKLFHTGYGEEILLTPLLDLYITTMDTLINSLGQVESMIVSGQPGSSIVAAGGVQVSQEALQAARDSGIDKLAKIQNVHLDGARRAEYNLLPTWYHEYFREDPRFTGSEDEIINPAVVWLPWCHRGAEWGWNPWKPEVPNLFSWEPVVSYFSRLSTVSMMWNELKDITPQLGENFHCMLTKNIEEGDWASEQLALIAPGNTGLDDDKKCLPTGFQDTLGPVTNLVKTLSPAKASETAASRALAAIDVWNNLSGTLAYTMGAQQGAGRRYHPWRRKSNPGLWGLKRDKQQILRNKNAPAGCGDFNGQDEWSTDIPGVVFDKMNEELKDEHGHWNVHVHWRYIRCCPRYTFPIPPIVPLQTY